MVVKIFLNLRKIIFVVTSETVDFLFIADKITYLDSSVFATPQKISCHFLHRWNLCTSIRTLQCSVDATSFNFLIFVLNRIVHHK